MVSGERREEFAPARIGGGIRLDARISIRDLAQCLAQSGYFADARTAAQAVVKVLRGLELGLGPIQAMTDVYVIEGRTAVSAPLIAALIRRSGRYDYRIVEHTDQACEVEILERGRRIGTSRFTVEDARRAGLVDRSEVWRKYPRNMLFARAISNAARWHCPDVFGGAVYTPQELLDAAPEEPVELPGPQPEEQAAEGAPPWTPEQRRAIEDLWQRRTRADRAALEEWLARRFGTPELSAAQAAEAIRLLQRMEKVT